MSVPLLACFSGLSGQAIVADHTIIDDYDIIPQQYIDSVKKMWVTVPGESHSYGYRKGLALLESMDARFQVNVRESGTPDPATDQNLRFSRATWGTMEYTSGWIYNYGEEDWFTSPAAIQRTKDGLLYAASGSFDLAATGFGWCWDMSWTNSPSGTVDPVYNVRWAGSTSGGTDGNRIWGLDKGDSILTGNRVTMDTYLKATEDYIAFCEANNLKTIVFFTTGPVDIVSYNAGEAGYQRYLKTKYIRDYMAARGSGYLFDYADILSWNNAGQKNTVSWTDYGSVVQSFEFIHPDNMIDLSGSYSEDGDHIGEVGTVRLAKAMWWLLARMAGWDGKAEVVDVTPPSVPTGVSAVATGESTVTLSWNASTDDVGVTAYGVYRDNVLVSTTAETGFSDQGLSPSTTYTYVITARDAKGNESAFSAEASVTTQAHVSTVDFSTAFETGFNWFSLNVMPDDLSLGSCFGANNIAGDYIKNQVYSSSYYDGYGWFGKLLELDPRDLYLFRAGQAFNMSLTGLPVDPDTAGIDISAGWNWIGYLPQTAMPLGEALASLTLADQDYIKDQVSSSTYYAGTGWFGTLSELSPGNGYMIRMANSGTLTYPATAPVKKLAVARENSPVDAYLNIHDFEFNGTVTARVLLDGTVSGSEEDLLLAYAGDECRGVTDGLYFSPTGTYLYPIMIYSNSAEGEEIHFSFLDVSENQSYELEGTITFEKDMVAGDAFNPLDFQNTGNLSGVNPAPGVGDLRIYPNPFSDRITIEITGREISSVNVAVYDLYGRLVEDLGNEGMDSGSFVWNAEGFAPGTYLVKVTGEQFNLVKRVVYLP